MLSKISFNFIFVIFVAKGVLLLDNQDDPSYLEQLGNSIGSGITNKLFDMFGSSDFFIEDEHAKAKHEHYNHLHAHKFSSPQLLEKCIKFHDSEIVRLDLSQLRGRWDRHLVSGRLPLKYDYGIVEYDEKDDFCKFTYFPSGYYSIKSVRNNTRIESGIFVANDWLGIQTSADEAIISIDYNSYFLKYSCAQIMGKVSSSLHLQLRPEATAQLESNPNLFSEILDNIPEKSLNKIKHLIPKLIHEIDDRFTNFGQNYAQTLTNRLEKYRKDNRLSDKSDDEVYEFLDKNCAHFKEEEIIMADLSTIVSVNWTLDFTDVISEKLLFNRISAQRLTNNTFSVSLFLGKKFLTDSDHYFDINARGFWTYTEGMRSLEVTLYSTHEHRIIYSCEERHIDGKLGFKEKLRYFSAEGQTKSRNLITYLHRLTKHLKPDPTLIKIKHLHRHLSWLKDLHAQHPYHDEL